MTYIESVEELRRYYAEPGERAVRKQLPRLDGHCRTFIERSPFVVIASGSAGQLDASPRGGAPGFVKVVDDVTLWIPDAPGNNRLDSLANIVASGRVGLLFLIPGIDETLRINGAARLSVDPVKLAHFAMEKRTPQVLLEIAVEQAFLHCAKALMRSRLWSDDARQPRDVLPTLGRMLADQLGTPGPVETQAQMLSRYERDLQARKVTDSNGKAEWAQAWASARGHRHSPAVGRYLDDENSALRGHRHCPFVRHHDDWRRAPESSAKREDGKSSDRLLSAGARRKAGRLVIGACRRRCLRFLKGRREPSLCQPPGDGRAR